MAGLFELRTTRLVLRPLGSEDAASIVAYRSLPEVARYQSWESFGPADAARLIADQSGVIPGTPGTWLQLALVLSESASVVGDCGIHFLADDPSQVELGITLAPAHQGRGLAAEALKRVLSYVFGELGKHRAWAVTDAENHAAAALFRRVGFRQEAHHIEHVRFKGAGGASMSSPCCAGSGRPTCHSWIEEGKSNPLVHDVRTKQCASTRSGGLCILMTSARTANRPRVPESTRDHARWPGMAFACDALPYLRRSREPPNSQASTCLRRCKP